MGLHLLKLVRALGKQRNRPWNCIYLYGINVFPKVAESIAQLYLKNDREKRISTFEQAYWGSVLFDLMNTQVLAASIDTDAAGLDTSNLKVQRC